jgi:hypothetical protein
MVYVAVGMNGSVVRFDPKRSKAELIKRFQKLGPVAGFAGVLMFNRAFRTYTRRLLVDQRAQEILDQMSHAFQSILEERMREESRLRGQDADKAIAYAEVYVEPEGKELSVYYSFGPKEFPEIGWMKAGTVYLADATTAKGHYEVPEGSASSWVIRFKLTDEKFADVMKQATQLFAKKLREVQVAAIPMEKE